MRARALMSLNVAKAMAFMYLRNGVWYGSVICRNVMA